MANIRAMVFTLIAIVIAAIIALNVFGETIDDVRDAGDDLNRSNRCTDVGCHFDHDHATATVRCNVSSASALTCATANSHAVPLGSLFNRSSVVPLVFLGAALIFSIGLIFKIKGGK